jgi:hypothetical protein
LLFACLPQAGAMPLLRREFDETSGGDRIGDLWI